MLTSAGYGGPALQWMAVIAAPNEGSPLKDAPVYQGLLLTFAYSPLQGGRRAVLKAIKSQCYS